jgi:insulysin
MKSCARSDHPFCSFSTGNADTLMKIPESLGLNPRDIVIEFYKKYYSSNIMKLAVYGNDSLDVMQKWVEEKFSAIPDKSLSSPRFPSDPYRPEQLAKLLQVVPVRDSKNLDIYFPTPAVEHLYLTKPTRCLSHLIGHESAGSILSALKVKGWANGLGCFLFQSYTDFSCFAVNVELTDEGVNHTDDVVACVFAYIGMLLKAGPAEWIVQETKEIAEMNFRFVDKIDAASYTTRLANSMQNTSPEHIVSGSELIFSIDTKASWDLLKFFTPENSFVVVKHKGLIHYVCLLYIYFQLYFSGK